MIMTGVTTTAFATAITRLTTSFQPCAYGQQRIGIIASSPGDWFDGERTKAAGNKAKQLGYVTLILC